MHVCSEPAAQNATQCIKRLMRERACATPAYRLDAYAYACGRLNKCHLKVRKSVLIRFDVLGLARPTIPRAGGKPGDHYPEKSKFFYLEVVAQIGHAWLKLGTCLWLKYGR